MRNFFQNKYVKGAAVAIFFIAVTLFVLRGFSLNGYNFWTDFSGNIDLATYFSKSQYLWGSNQIGNFQFSSPANLWFHLYVKAMYSIFGLTRGTYFVFYFLVLSSFGAAYYMAKSILDETKRSVLLALFLVLNPLYLYYLFGTGTTTFIAAFTGLYLAFGLFERYRKTREKKYLLGLLLSSILVSHPFLFPFFCVVFGYLLWVKASWKTALGFVAAALALHLYWIIPFLASYLFKGQALLGSYTAGLVGIFSSNGLYQYSFLFLGRSYTFVQEFYGHGEVFVYLLIFAFWLALARWALVGRRSKELLAYWPLIILLLIFSVGPREPFGAVYDYLFNKFSFFSFFRSYQNVFIILFPFVAYVAILGSAEKESRKNVLASFSVVALLLFVVFASSQQLDKGSTVPGDYFQASQIVNADQSSGRVLLLPISQYDYYSWDKPTEDKYFLEAFFAYKGIAFYRPTVDDPKLRNVYDGLYNNPDFNYKGLTDLGVQYILVRKDLTHEQDGYFQKFTRTIDPAATDLVLDTKNISLYKIKDPQPYVVAQNATYQRVSPVKYNLTLTNVRPGETISFKELYNTGWKLYPSTTDLAGCVSATVEGNEEECPAINQALSLRDVSYLRKPTIALESHSTVDGYDNTWTIQASDIANLPSGSYTKNSDGSYNINLTIYFEAQSFSYLGLIISGVSLMGVALYLLLSKNKKKELHG